MNPAAIVVREPEVNIASKIVKEDGTVQETIYMTSTVDTNMCVSVPYLYAIAMISILLGSINSSTPSQIETALAPKEDQVIVVEEAVQIIDGQDRSKRPRLF